MKKYFAILMLVCIGSFASAQSTSPRFGTLKNQDNTGRALTYGYVTPAYAASVALVPRYYDTTVKVGQLTGNLTLTVTVTNCYVGDKLEIVLAADATDRTVTFSTGFTSGGTVLIPASGTFCYYFTFNGVGWIHASKSVFATSTGLNVNGNVTTTTGNIQNHTQGVAIPITATITAAQLATGLLTTTSAAAVTMTLPTATQIATQIGATQGTVFEFIVDNSAGANTVTVAVGSGITASGFPATNTLTLGASTTIGTAGFRLVFISATAATLTRIN